MSPASAQFDPTTGVAYRERVGICQVFAISMACLSVYWVIFLPATQASAAVLMALTSALHQLVQLPLMPRPATPDDVGVRLGVLLVNFVVGSVGLHVLEHVRIHASIPATQWALFSWNALFLGCQGLAALQDKDVNRGATG